MDNVYLIEEPDFVKCFFVKCTVTLNFHFEEKPVEIVRVFERLFVTFCFNSFTIHSVLTEKLLVFLDIRELNGYVLTNCLQLKKETILICD